MACESCGDKPKNESKYFPKAVVEINNPEYLTMFRKVVIPVSMGDDTDIPPVIGKYYNVLLVYEANNHAYLYSSDGIPTLLTSDVAQDLEKKIDTVAGNLQIETVNRQNADIALGNRLTAVEGVAATAVQPAAINKIFMTDISIGANTSTTTVQIDGAKENILTGVTSTKNVALPVASTTQAGVMNSSTYDAVTNNTNNLNAIMNGAVAVTGIAASPSQSDLTTAWQTETGLSALINRASIYDVDNNKVWTYYTNDTSWHAASNTSQVTINTFTNSSEGTIKGSTNVGQIFAENDGTGSVNGWDNLSNAVSTNTSNIASLQGTIPVITMTDTDPGEGAPLAANNFVAVYGGDPIIMDYSTTEINTGAKWIDGSAIYKKTIDFGSLPNSADKSVNHGISNLGWVVEIKMVAKRPSDDTFFPVSFASNIAAANGIGITVNSTAVVVGTGIDRTNLTQSYVTLYYTKTA